jgi:chromatin remodeling complex protein RSC6
MKRIILIGQLTAIICACRPSTQNQQETTILEKKVGMVEITTFKLNQNVAFKDFEESARSMQKEFLEKQSGFIKRTLTVSQDSIWTDIVFWNDELSQKKTAKLFETSELILPFIEKIDFNSVKMNLTSPVLIQE